MTYEKNKSKYRSLRTFNLILIRNFQPDRLSEMFQGKKNMDDDDGR